MLLARNRVVTVVEVEAVLAFLSPGADHHVKLVAGRGVSGGSSSRGRAQGRWGHAGEAGTYAEVVGVVQVAQPQHQLRLLPAGVLCGQMPLWLALC